MISRYFSALHTNWWLKIKLVVVLYFSSFEKVTCYTNSCRVRIQINQALIKASNSRKLHKDEGENPVAKDVSVDLVKVLLGGGYNLAQVYYFCIRLFYTICVIFYFLQEALFVLLCTLLIKHILSNESRVKTDTCPRKFRPVLKLIKHFLTYTNSNDIPSHAENSILLYL